MEDFDAKLELGRSYEGRRANLQTRIDAQIALVERLVPGTPSHRLATDTLLVFQDTLYLLEETQRILCVVQNTIASMKRAKD